MKSQVKRFYAEGRHSWLGIVSVVIAVGLPALLILFLIIAALLGSKKGSVGSIIGVGFVVVGLSAPLLHFVGFVLGAIGWYSRKTRKLFPVVGTILNAILGISGIILIYLFISNFTWGFR